MYAHTQGTVICDLDGTLCDLNGRDPYNPDTCSEDLVRPMVLEVLQLLEPRYQIVYVSGRWERARGATRVWLSQHGAPFGTLVLRPEGDYSSSNDFKLGIVGLLRQCGHHIVLALDDRRANVEQYRALGIEAWQVAVGYEKGL